MYFFLHIFYLLYVFFIIIFLFWYPGRCVFDGHNVPRCFRNAAGEMFITGSFCAHPVSLCRGRHRHRGGPAAAGAGSRCRGDRGPLQAQEDNQAAHVSYGPRGTASLAQNKSKHLMYALIACRTSWYLMYTLIVCCTSWHLMYTYCMLYFLALNVHTYCMSYVLALSVV